MAAYIQFFHETRYVEGSIPPRFNGPPRLVESCGSSALVQVDARLSIENIRKIAENVGNQRDYKAWQLLRGSCLREARPASPIHNL